MAHSKKTCSRTDKEWLQKRYKRLLIIEQGNTLIFKGNFDFKRVFKNVAIEDTYKVRFEISFDGTRPLLWVVDQRLHNVLKARRPVVKNLADMHMYANGALCTITPQGWDLVFAKKMNIRKYFVEYIEPYFYSQSFFETNGSWPWSHYSHNTKGLIEWYLENWRIEGAAKSTAAEIKKLQTRDEYARVIISRAQEQQEYSLWNRCLCASTSSYLNCHPLLANLTYELNA